MTDAGGEFYRHAAEMLQQAEQAEASIRHRLSEPIGTVRFTSGMATMQFALREVVADFLVRHPKVNVVAHATDQNVDIVGENYDVAVRAHSDPLPSSTLVQRTLVPAPWLRLGSTDPKVGQEFALKNVLQQTVARLGQPKDIAFAVCFIASPLSDFMTGTTFRIDGGATPTI